MAGVETTVVVVSDSHLSALTPDALVNWDVVVGYIDDFRILDFDDRRHVWAPTTWAVLPDSVQRAIGAKRCGVVSLSLPVSGHADISLVEPPGISQLTVTREVPNPYSD